MKKFMVIICILILFNVSGFCAATVLGENLSSDGDKSKDEQICDEIIEALDFDCMDEYTKEYIPEKMSFTDLVENFSKNDGKEITDSIFEYLYNIFFYELDSIKPTIIQVFGFTMFFMIISKIVFWRKDYVYKVSCLLVYASILSMLFASFRLISEIVLNGIDSVLAFLSALIPSYATVLALAGNGFSASGFYVLTFAMVYIIEWMIRLILVPGIHFFLLFEVLNHMFEEERLSKIAALIELLILKILKGSVAIVAGIGIVQSIIAPAKDRISDSLILNSFSAIPGVGNITNSTAEIFLGCAMLIKNSVGVAALVILFFIVIAPLIKAFIFSIMYRLLAAILEPVADRQIVDGINSVARAGDMYYRVLRDCAILFFIVIAIVCASTSFIN